jgi:hypothetical protein
VDEHLAAVGIFQAIKQAQQGGFSGAAAADDAENFALTDGQVNVLQRLHAVRIGFADTSKLNMDRWGGDMRHDDALR